MLQLEVNDTVDGRNPALVDMENISVFVGFYTSQVLQDFFHQQYNLNIMYLPTYIHPIQVCLKESQHPFVFPQTPVGSMRRFVCLPIP